MSESQVYESMNIIAASTAVLDLGKLTTEGVMRLGVKTQDTDY